jgi:hypothetical protein
MPKNVGRCAILAAAITLMGLPAAAQEALEMSPAPRDPYASDSPLLPGTRVRLEAPSVLSGRVKGQVARLDPDAVVVEVGDHLRVRVPREAVTRLEVSTARQRMTWVGAAVGAVALGLGTGLSAPVKPECAESYWTTCYSSRGEAIAVEGLAGALIGGLIGHFVTVDRWHGVNPRQIRVTAQVGSRQVGAGVSITF